MMRPGDRMAARISRGIAGRRSRELFTEYDAAMARTQAPEIRAWRERQGWPRSATLMGLGGACCRIIIHAASGMYTPAEDGGAAAILIPVWPGQAPGRPEDLVDLLAWVPATGALLSRWGLADVLGMEAIEQAGPCLGAGTLHVFSDPGAWARAATWEGPASRGAQGIVIARWDRVKARVGHLTGAADFVCDSLALARRLRAALEPDKPALPRILVSASQMESAA